MLRHTTQALVLKRVAYQESDWVLTLLTHSMGKVCAMARGARASSKRFPPAVLQPFCLFEACLESHPKRELMVLSAAQRPMAYHGILADLDALAAGWRALELLDVFSSEHQENTALFELALQSFRRYDAGFEPWQALAFEAQVLCAEGFGSAKTVDLLRQLEAQGPSLALAGIQAYLERELVAHAGHSFKTTGLDRQLRIDA
jgi:DNA repair protein RecO (recombination protein O)